MPFFDYQGRIAVFRTFVHRYTMEITPEDGDPPVMFDTGNFWRQFEDEMEIQANVDTDEIDDADNMVWSGLVTVEGIAGQTNMYATHQVATLEDLVMALEALIDDITQSDETAELEVLRVSWDEDLSARPGGAGKKRSRAQMTHVLSQLSTTIPEEYKSVGCYIIETVMKYVVMNMFMYIGDEQTTTSNIPMS